MIGFFTFEDIWSSTTQYLDYLKDGDEEKLAGMIEDALWAGLFDLAVYAGGRVLKKLAESVDLKVKDCTQWPAGGKYSEKEIQSILDNIQGSGFKNNPLRQEYESEVRALKSYGEELLKSGKSEEEVARTLNQARRDLGVKYKDMTPQPLRDYIYEINEARYGGDKLGPTYDYMKGEGKSDLEIIDSSSRPNTDIDSLLGDFENWLRGQ